MALRICLAWALFVLPGCSEPVSWQRLLASKITQEYPSYNPQATADGQLLVQRPGLPALPVDVTAISQFCLRGPRDCAYATDQMLIALRPAQ